VTEQLAPPIDPGALIRSRGYIGVLVLAAIVGLVVSVAGWLFLELTVRIKDWVYGDLPTAVGFAAAPTWWPLPVLTISGLIVGFAVERLPGAGGHRPAAGLASGPPTIPAHLPGVVLAALAGISLGVVLGPEAPLIALGGGLGLLTIDLLRRGASDQVKLVIAAAGSFAAISTIFGNPVIGAVVIVEASGLGGPMLPLVLVPGLLAAGIGSVLFLGMGSLTGLSTADYALTALGLPAAPNLTAVDFVWAIVLAVVAAVAVRVLFEVAWAIEPLIARRRLALTALAGIGVALLAIAFEQATGEPEAGVLFSGQDAMPDLAAQATTITAATLAWLLVFKGLAWSVSLASFRGGPTFPAMFLGMAGGLLMASLTSLPETTAIAIAMGATTVATLRLPLSSVIMVLVVTQTGLTVAPLVVLAVVVAYILTEALGARRGVGSVRAPAAATGRAG
jgi:H+/Cl- antiporter ClcA